MDNKRLAAHAALQTLYTLHGIDNPLILPAMQRQVEHRSEGLSRRGFLGLVGAGGAGLMAGAIFDPAVKLWTPTAGAVVEVTPGQLLRVDGALQELARLFALAIDESSNRANGYDITPRPQYGQIRTILHTTCDDVMPWIVETARPFYFARGSVTAPIFNERRPLPTSAVELDPTVRVADYLSPRKGVLARIIQYDQASGSMGAMQTWTDFEVAGIYRAPKA